MSSMDSDLTASDEALGPQKSIKRLKESPENCDDDGNEQDEFVACENGSPLEDGEIADEDLDSPSPESSSKPSPRVSDNADGKCGDNVVPLKRALVESCNKDYANKGRRLNTDSEVPRFHRPTTATKSLSRTSRPSPGSSKSSSYSSRSAENVQNSAAERQWNTQAADQQRPGFRNTRQSRKQTPVCRFFIESRCNKGAECTFSHDVQPIKRYELCKFYLNGFCVKHDHCNFMHSDFPCKFFHGPHGECSSGGQCRFSHDPITDSRVKVALEKVLNEGSSSSEQKPPNSAEWDQNKTRQATSSQSSSKPSLLGSPPSDGNQCRHPLSVASKPPAGTTENYYKESILSVVEPSTPSEPPSQTDNSKANEECLRRPVHQRAPRPIYPAAPPHEAFCTDMRPSRFQGQWTMPPMPHHPAAPPRQHCPESMRQPAIFPPFRVQPPQGKFGAALPRMRVPPPPGQHFPPNDMHWMSGMPGAVRYRYPWAPPPPPQRMPPSRPPIEEMPVQQQPPPEVVAPMIDKECSKYTTLQDLINAIGIEKTTLTTQNRFAQLSSACTAEQSVCARLEELIRSIQTNKDSKESKPNSSQETPVARIEPKTGPFVYRLYKIDLSGIRRPPRGEGILTVDENNCRDPRIRNELKHQNKDPRLLDSNYAATISSQAMKSKLCASRPTDPRLMKNHSDIR